MSIVLPKRVHFYTLTTHHTFSTSLFLYNQCAHLYSQRKSKWRVYELHSEDAKVMARISFQLIGGEAVSPYRAPFGGVEIYHSISTLQLKEFLCAVEVNLTKRGITKINIKGFPKPYHKTFTQIKSAFTTIGYKTKEEITSIISLDEKPFEKKIRISERQKLRKAKQLFRFEKMESESAKMIYSFIAACRKERNQTLSMTVAQLLNTLKVLPHSFLFFRVSNDEITASACIAIRVNENILYTLYYGHARKFDKVSPVVYLLSGVYAYAQENNFRIIDLGTSMWNGKVNRSLLHFKSSVGGQACEKLTFTKALV